MIGRVTRRMLPHLAEVPHLHVNGFYYNLNFPPQNSRFERYSWQASVVENNLT